MRCSLIWVNPQLFLLLLQPAPYLQIPWINTIEAKACTDFYEDMEERKDPGLFYLKFLSRLHAQHRAQHGASTHDPEIKSQAEIKNQTLKSAGPVAQWITHLTMDQKNQTLNQQSHPSTPKVHVFLVAF